MPSPKQVREHYGRVSKLFDRLCDALNVAHAYEVIKYTDYAAESPCKLVYEAIDRFNETTKNQLAAAMREEIRFGNAKKPHQ